MKDKNKPCIVCGKPTAAKTMINYDNASGKCVDPSFNGGNSGWQPIGADCKKGFPKDWVIE